MALQFQKLIFVLTLISSSKASEEVKYPPNVAPSIYKLVEDHKMDVSPEVLEEIEKPAWNPEHVTDKHEREHIQEHIDVPDVDTSQMTEEELQFHYFKIHDSDNNNHLDGCELIKSVIHWHEEDQHSVHHEQGDDGQTEPDENGLPIPVPREKKIWSDEDLENIIDPILQRHDLDNDGLISYTEFKSTLNSGSTV